MTTTKTPPPPNTPKTDSEKFSDAFEQFMKALAKELRPSFETVVRYLTEDIGPKARTVSERISQALHR